MLERALRRDRADLGALGVHRQLAQDARLTTQRRLQELHREQARLKALGEQADHARLAQIAQELAQLHCEHLAGAASPTGLSTCGAGAGDRAVRSAASLTG